MQTVVTGRPPPTTWWEFWREVARRAALRVRSLWSAPGQPAWARPLLLVIAAVAAWSYAWRATRPVNIEIYYAAAARSMTMSVSNFFFGAFDPAGTVTTDKLPGALWLQGISAGVFGLHNWALVLPQVIEGTLTVLVLYRAVRQVAGPPAGLVAAGLLAVSPAAVALDRGNISDTLMILLAVLAADSVISAIRTGRWRPLLLAGLWVGLAFQAKMLEAWLVLPALAGCYLLAAPGGWPQRARRCGAMALLAVVISLSWMSLVTIWPAGSRSAFPYLMATQTAVLAAPFIWASGREVVPIGGFTGTIPEPTLATLQNLIRTGFVATFLQSPTTTDPRLTWIARYCMNVTPRAAGQHAVLPLAVYVCLAHM